MDSAVDEMLESVNSRDSFLAFIKILQLDKEQESELGADDPSPPYSSGIMGWENGTIEAFLESMHAWAVDSGSLGVEPSWQAFGQILRAGKGYE